MKITYSVLLTLSLIVISCKDKNEKSELVNQPEITNKEVEQEASKFKNKAHELIYNMVQKVGTYQDLLSKKDVVYTYTYITPDGKTDISTEKYLFHDELSYGKYTQHERTFPELEGAIEQSFDGTEYWLKHKGLFIDDEKSIKTVVFKRPTNFYWFTMLQKLLDPNLNYEFIGEKDINTIKYDVVKVSFNSDKPTDIYQVYINRETGLIDQFLFTVADFGIMNEPRIMQIEYEKIEGILIPTKRKYKKSDWNATVDDKPWISVNWTNIKFNNGLTILDFKK